MSGGKNKQPLGYTIVEVMIVLAISGLMLVLAAQFINGKQARTTFTQGVNDMASRIQTTIQDVADGRYSDIAFSCSGMGGSSSLTLTTAATAQGKKNECVFMGKFYYFYNNGGNNPTNYELFSLAGARAGVSNKVITTLDQTALTPIDDQVVTTRPDLTLDESMPQQIQVRLNGLTVMTGASPTPAVTYGFGFVQGLGTDKQNDTSDTIYEDGAQSIRLVYSTGLPNVSMGPGRTPNASASLTPTLVREARIISMCLTDGQRFATITIESSSDRGEQPLVRVDQGVNTC